MKYRSSKSSTQLSLIPQASNRRVFGGSLLRGRRKTLRPLSRKEALHFVLRSHYGRGTNSFRSPRNLQAIDRILSKAAQKYGVRLYRRSIQSNHIHLILRIQNRLLYRSFISVISGRIAQHVMRGLSFKEFLRTLPSSGEGALAPHPIPAPQKGQAFWEYRPFHRILNWGRDFKIACGYVVQNTLEALGFVPYRPRAKRGRLSSA